MSETDKTFPFVSKSEKKCFPSFFPCKNEFNELFKLYNSGYRFLQRPCNNIKLKWNKIDWNTHTSSFVGLKCGGWYNWEWFLLISILLRAVKSIAACLQLSEIPQKSCKFDFLVLCLCISQRTKIYHKFYCKIFPFIFTAQHLHQQKYNFPWFYDGRKRELVFQELCTTTPMCATLLYVKSSQLGSERYVLK